MNPTATMQRYDAFRRLMDSDGWLEQPPTWNTGQPNACRVWDYPNGAMYDVTGLLWTPDGREGKAEPWEVYLEAGVSPPPF